MEYSRNPTEGYHLSILNFLAELTRNTSRPTEAVRNITETLLNVKKILMLTNGSDANISQEVDSDPSSAATAFVRIGEFYIIPTILLIAVITNAVSLTILPRARIVRTFRQCLVALTISDLFATTIGFSSSVMEIKEFGGNMPHGYWNRKALGILVLYYLQVMFMSTSATIVIFIVATRHLLVKNPLKARQLLTPFRTRWILFFLYIIVLVLFIPTCLNIMWQSCHNDLVAPQCKDIYRSIPNLEKMAKYYLYTLTTIFGPVLIIVYIICLIGIRANLRQSEEVIRKLTESRALVDGSPNPSDYANQSSMRRVKATSKITKTLVMIVVLDAICTLPTVAQGIAQLISPQNTVFSSTNTAFQVFDVISEIFLAMRPAYNFWLYVFTHEEFRNVISRTWYAQYFMRLLDMLPCFESNDKSSIQRQTYATASQVPSSDSEDRRCKSITTNITTM